MSFEWNHEQVEKLIEAYRDKPELWDPKSNNYHIRNKKHDAWVLIVENIGCSIVEAKTKMTSLLYSYRREKVKMKKSIGTGKGRDEIFVSTWFAFKYFEFLKEKDAPFNRINTEEPDNGNDIGNVSDEEDLEHELNRITESQENPRNLGTEKAAENFVQNPDPTSRDGPPKRKVSAAPSRQNEKQKRKEDPRLTRAYNILDSVANAAPDECSTFGEYIALKLRKFTAPKRSILMHEINNIIYNSEMELYSQDVSSSSPSSSGYTPPHFMSAPYSFVPPSHAPQNQYHSMSAPHSSAPPSHIPQHHATYHSLSTPQSPSQPSPVSQEHSMSVPNSPSFVPSPQFSPLQQFVTNFNVN